MPPEWGVSCFGSPAISLGRPAPSAGADSLFLVVPMKLEPQVTFKNVDPSDAALGQIQSHLDGLNQRGAGIVACHVVVERPQYRNQQGDRLRVALALTLSGGLEIAVNHEAQSDRRADPRAAAREAFEIAERRLLDVAHRRRDGRHQSRPGVVEWEQS